MNIIVYPQIYGVGGIARYLQSYLAALGDAARDTVVVTGSDEGRPLDLGGARLLHLPMGRSRLGLVAWSWRMRQTVKRLCAEHPGSVINLHIPPLLPGLLLPRCAPVVVTAHTTYLGMSGQFYQPRHFDSQWPWLSVVIKRWMEHWIFRRADRIVTLTEQGRQELLRYRQDKPIDLLPNGVSCDEFRPDGAVAKDYDVLFAGRIERRKGSRPMVLACRALVALRPDVRIAIVGYGDDDAHVQAELAGLKANVHLVGKVPFAQVMGYYQRSKVYASTSYYEGLPGTCLEAMATGLPVVAWDYLFYAGLVAPGGSGELVPVNDVPAFAKAVVGLLDDGTRRQAMGVQARAAVEQGYAWARLAPRLMAVFQAATGQAGVHHAQPR